jgi:tetratricopeptide (TPR) repeat protein/transcriptional regulator with XRE-family HTH domain
MADAHRAARSFGDVLRAHRDAATLTQEELAERAQLSVRAIADLERGRTARPRPDSVRRLAAALGLIEPALGQFHLAARGMPAAGSFSGESGGPDNQVVPRLLPAAVPAFAGRRPELAVLSRMLDQPGGMAVITAIGGTAGVGKTALAIYWGHQVAAEFPDGQLFVNLRGFDPSGTPVVPADAMPVLLEALGVSPDRIPGALDAQAGLYRSLLAGKRMLIVLDNANDEAQVRPLLPGSLTCRVVVTSRNQLTGLAAIEAARLLMLDVLTGAEASELLQQRLGADRLSADPSAAAQIIRACAHLPLALSIIAARVAAVPGLSLTRVAQEVAGSPDLGEFSGGHDPAADVRIVLSWSYRQLDPGAARAFRLAGLHPGADLDRYAVAALTQTTPEQAGQVLAVLAHGCLVQATGPDRYRTHDLLRGYARELAEVQDPEGERRAALTRLFDYYLRTASIAMDILVPAEQEHRPRIPRPAAPCPALADPAAARAWLDTERDSLVAVAAHTAAHSWPRHTIQLAGTLSRYLSTGCYHPEAITIHGSARRAARDTGDQDGEASALKALGLIDMRQGRCPQAVSYLQQALDLYRQVGDRFGEASALNDLGGVDWRQARYPQAASYLRQALDLYRQIGDRFGEARTLGNLGVVDERQGRYPLAATGHRQALALFREIGDKNGQARALANLGVVDLRQGRLQQAADHLRQAIDPYREAGDRNGEAYALAALGVTGLRQGHVQQAAGHLQEAMIVFRETGDLAGEAEALNGLGELSLATGQPGDARSRHTSALDLATQADDMYQWACAHQGLGSVSDASGDPSQARHHWQHALTLHTRLGTPEADMIRARLAEDSRTSDNPPLAQLRSATRKKPFPDCRDILQAARLSFTAESPGEKKWQTPK